jgi:hypothetical protein
MSKTKEFAVTKKVMLYTGYPDHIPVIIEYGLHYSNQWVGPEDIGWVYIKTNIIDSQPSDGPTMLETSFDITSTFPVRGPGAGAEDISFRTHGFVDMSGPRCGKLVEKNKKVKKC